MEDKSGRESKKRLWDTGRYLVGCLLLLCMAGKSYAQGDDFGVWTSAEVKKKIFSGFDASLEGEFRTRDGLQTVERWSGSAGVSYKMFRWLKASAGYTFIHYPRILAAETSCKLVINRKGGLAPLHVFPS